MPGSQFCRLIKDEFQRKNFGFGDVHFARFSYWQWPIPPGVVIVYRFILAAYFTFWLCYTSYRGPTVTLNGVDIPTFAFLTTWTYFMLTVYLLMHFVACVIMACNRGGSLWSKPSREHHRSLFHELQVVPSLWGSDEYSVIPGSDTRENNTPERQSDVTVTDSTSSLPWILKLVWILYNIASAACLMVTIVFWALLFPYLNLSPEGFQINFQLHAVTSIIILIEHIVSAVPFRFLHLIHPIIYGLIYVVFSGIYYAVDHRHVLYPKVLDWTVPGRTAIILVIVALVLMPLIQLFFFAIYKIRTHIYDKLYPEQL